MPRLHKMRHPGLTAPEFCRRISALGYSQRGFAAYVGANERTVRRWALDEQDIPAWVSVVLDLLEALRQWNVRPGFILEPPKAP